MSKKTLLKEATIRRFMKLASIGPLTETFVEKVNEMGPYGRDEGEDLGEEEELAPLPGEGDLPAPEGEELPGGELPGEELPGEEPGLDLTPEQAEGVAEKLAQGFADVVEDALGIEGLLNVSTEEVDEELPMEPPMDELPMDEPPADEPPTDEPPMDEPLEDESLEEEKLSEKPREEQSIDDITNKVANALYERIKKDKEERQTKKTYVDNLAERVVNRIFSSSKSK